MKNIKRIIIRILPHLLLLGVAAFAVYKQREFAALKLGLPRPATPGTDGCAG